MGVYPAPAVERAMKVQEVILRAMSGEFAWVQATEILGLSARSMRRWRARYEEHGYDGLYDRPPRAASLTRRRWNACSGSSAFGASSRTPPQALGRKERFDRTVQGRWPQELRLRGVTTMAAANAWLQEVVPILRTAQRPN